ncbi:DUF1446 domain-containing protein [Acidithiobacillus montserratensis]|uniref:DUF1446 domain-containing protein n=1 Tax=Acidithiobacillus montserratensis TaxID=2729135 RepID=A0ACD5HJS5_9PROT|nr:DUF1446 domain-containing protein [Acidithiobacillus montserratensis]MBU2749091.1 hypothetical protein [Acidithiobacillus montserratensis]
MKIKISLAEKDSIDDILHRVNGGSASHTLTRFEEILDLANTYEYRLEKLGLVESMRRGAVVICGSYRNSFRVTEVHLLRGLRDWFLTHVEAKDKWPGNSQKDQLFLTKEQNEYLVNKFRSQYKVNEEAGHVNYPALKGGA